MHIALCTFLNLLSSRLKLQFLKTEVLALEDKETSGMESFCCIFNEQAGPLETFWELQFDMFALKGAVSDSGERWGIVELRDRQIPMLWVGGSVRSLFKISLHHSL